MLNENDYRFLIANALFDKNLINGHLYIKCSKPKYIQALPGDGRTNDPKLLQERKDAILQKWNKIRDKIESKNYPDEFWDIAFEEDIMNDFPDYFDKGAIWYIGDKVVDYYNGLLETDGVLLDNAYDSYKERINDISNQMKVIDDEQKSLNSDLKEIDNDNNRLARDFNKFQKDFLSYDDEYNSKLNDPALLNERKSVIEQIKDRWNSYGMQNPYHYYDDYEMDYNEDEEGYLSPGTFDYPLSDRDSQRFAELRSKINENINILDNLYKNGIMTSDKETELLNNLARDISEYGSYIYEPSMFDIDEMAGLRNDCEVSLPRYIKELTDVPQSLKDIKDKRDNVKDKLDNVMSKRNENDVNIQQIKDRKANLRKDKKNLKERKSILQESMPKKKDKKTRLTDIREIRDLAKEFASDISMAQQYQNELFSINLKLNQDSGSGLPYEYGDYIVF